MIFSRDTNAVQSTERKVEVYDHLQWWSSEVRRLRHESSYNRKRIAALEEKLVSPVFLIKAAFKSLAGLPRALAELRHSAQDNASKLQEEINLIRQSGVFDEKWYLSQYPDVAASSVDPIAHYLTNGAAEGRNPSPRFSTRSYISNYADVAPSGLNPLYHYLTRGRLAGRHPSRNNYRRWVSEFDVLTDNDRQVFKRAGQKLQAQPTISILMPLGRVETERLERALESLQKQFYPNWELCISTDATTSLDIRMMLDVHSQMDPRIRIVSATDNQSSTALRNLAFGLATAEYVALMGFEDALSEHALFWVAHEASRHPDADIIYSDEDAIDDSGARYDGLFKPDWNPALILSQNFVGRLAVFRRELVELVGAFRADFEGSEEYDLVLRCVEQTTPECIRHIPRVLYHRHLGPARIDNKNGAPGIWQTGAAAIARHLERRSIDAVVSAASSQFYQIEYRPRVPLPRVSIVIPSTCNLNLLRPCINRLLESTYPDFEILIAVNETSLNVPAQAEYLKSLKVEPRVRVLAYNDRPFNFSAINNWTVKQTTGSVVCFMNDDIEIVTADWLERFVARLQLEGVGAVGPMLYYPNDTVQQAGVILGIGSVAGHAFAQLPRGDPGYFGRAVVEQDVSCSTAACMAMRREIFDGLGGFNETLAIAFNDVDLCIRIRRAGWRIIWTPSVEHYHHESASIGKHDSPERRSEFEREAQLMRDTWSPELSNDPFYNPNLSLWSHNYELSFPPRIEKLPAI